MGLKPRPQGPATIQAYNDAQVGDDSVNCERLRRELDRGLAEAESRIWHAHPVWFLDGNPIVGYSKLADCIRLMFWSGQSFGDAGLQPEGSFKAAVVRYTAPSQIDTRALARWLESARRIQWDYKNIVKRRGTLVRLR